MGKGLETEASTPETDERSVEVSELVFQVLGHAKNRTLALLGSAFPSPTLFPLPKLALSLNKAVRRLDPWRTVEDLSTGSAPLPRQIGLRYLAMGCSAWTPRSLVITTGAMAADQTVAAARRSALPAAAAGNGRQRQRRFPHAHPV